MKQKSEALTLQAFHNENIKDFFSKLETLLQNEKEKLIAEYQTDSSSNMNKAELYFSNIQNITFEIDRFQDDINQNYAKIINKMELEPFLEIMQKYEEKLQSLIRESFQIEKPIISYKTHDFKKPCKDFLENIRNLLHVFLGIDVKTLEIHDEPSKNLSSEQLTHNRDIFKDKTNEITNSGLRKTSLANKETQEKILQEFSSQTQRNIQSSNNNNEHIYSSIINTMSVKKTNNMKGFFSGLGKNFKTFNENNSLVGNNKAKHITGNFDTRNSTGHVPMTQNQTKAK